MTKFILKSNSFENSKLIPEKYSYEGGNISPHLLWENTPVGTKSFVLLVDDYDAPGGLWNHWLVYNIPHTVNEIAEDIRTLPSAAKMGKNTWGQHSYGGPCPPQDEEHDYHFKLFALDDFIHPKNRPSRDNIEHAMQHHIIDQAELIGKYLGKEKPLLSPLSQNDLEDAMLILNQSKVAPRIKEKAAKEIEASVEKK